MRTFTNDELKEMLERHKMWLKNEKGGERADLRCANLRSADLSSADLRGADLRCADLRCADLSSADLSSADLSYADLRYANLGSANLGCANLRGADLRCADLRSADLGSANLRCADLRSADLRCADLRCADLSSADLSYADLRRTKNMHFIPIACPDTGEFVAWKKVENKIVKLKVTAGAKRSSATTTKCRCSEAIVLAIENIDGTESGLTEIVNRNYKECIYKVGEIVMPDSFDDNRWNECSHGVHFFINREEAVNWRG